MPYRDEEYVKLVLRPQTNKPGVWLKCLRATAQHHGWMDALAEWPPAGRWTGRYWVPDHTTYTTLPASRSGLRLRICRTRSRRGWPAGATNCFRVSKNARNADLAYLASVTTSEWFWMESKGFSRWERDRWLAMAAAVGQGALGGQGLPA